jgi:hypothetical protein
MGISAIALLRLGPDTRLTAAPARVKVLDDAILLDTQADFAKSPEDLTRIVRQQVGDAIDREHTDARGIFFVPNVAAPTSRTYAGVIEEVGEGGVWGPLRVAASPLTAAMAGGSLGALLGGLLEQMPSSVLESVGAAARGQSGAFEAASAQLQATLAKNSGDPNALNVANLGAMLESSGIDLNAMQALVSQVGAALEQDPARAAALAEQLFGAGADDAGDEDDEDVDEDEDTEVKQR